MVELYDTTLRDGAQTEGVSYSVYDKTNIVKRLDDLGIHFIEGGWPGSNPKDKQFFDLMKKIKLRTSQLVAFGSTRRTDTRAARDINLKGLVASGAKTVTIFGKTWD